MITLSTKRREIRHQRGFIAVFLMLTIALAAVAVFSKNIWSGDSKAAQQKITQNTLRQAKEALLTYVEIGTKDDLSTAILLQKINGRLPCPDQDGDGQSPPPAPESPCGIGTGKYSPGYHSIGLLPWATLGIPLARDSASECLWYATDGLLKINTPSTGVNSDVLGSFSIIQPVQNNDGTWTESLLAGNTNGATITDPNRVVAVIIAPGSARDTQDRTKPSTSTNPCATPTGLASADVAQYLEGYTSPNSAGISGSNKTLTDIPNTTPLPKPINTALQTFVQADPNQEKLNDQVIWITADEFAKAATKRTARIFAKYINDYVTNNGAYPPAAATPGGTCVTSPKNLLQGFMPYTCTGKTKKNELIKSEDDSSSSRADRLSGDPDWWAGQAHYAVSNTCVSGGGAISGGCTANINLGGSAKAQAIIIMRGRAMGTQKCPYLGPINTPLPDISTCIEDTTNAATISTATAAIPTNQWVTNMSTVTYAIPDAAKSNDYMVQFP